MSTREMLDSADFRRLVARRWTVSVALSLTLFVTYYGYILLVAWDKPLLARKLGPVVTLGIPVGVGVILVSWILTALYVVWANRTYDVEVRRLRDKLDGQER
jgi:uncharacterized membrane protein (DUF485 family)